ncbi:MAG: hypothetical protein V4456_11405 [Bacteroidota bacterium]
MGWAFNNILSNLIVIVLLALANNLCFVAVAKIRKWRLERKDTIQKLNEEIEDLEKCNAKLLDQLDEMRLASTDEKSLILTHYSDNELITANS